MYESISDHKLLRLKCKSRNVEKRKEPSDKFVLDFDRADDVGVLDYLGAVLSELDCSMPVNEMWERLKHI